MTTSTLITAVTNTLSCRCWKLNMPYAFFLRLERMIVHCLNIIDHQSCNKGPRLYTDNKDVIFTTTTLIFRVIREYVQETENAVQPQLLNKPYRYQMIKAYKDLFTLNTIKCVT